MRAISLNLISLAFLVVTSSLGANIVVNPNFQTQSLTPWIANTQVEYDWERSSTGGVNSGCIGSPCVDENNLASANYIYQNLGTAIGGTYNLFFDYASAGAPSELKVLWGGTVVLDLIDSSTDLTQYSVSNLLAGAGSTRLMFLARQDPGFNFLSNIDVEQTNASAVPEPAAVTLLLGGIGVIGALRLRRKP